MESVNVIEFPTPIASATALIEVLDTHNRIHSRHRLVTAGSTCRVGRSVSCDIVLDDPYAAAEHTLLEMLADGRVAVNDLGSRNGTRVDGKRIDASAPAAITDGELIVGRTRVRVRTALTALTPERVFRRDLLQRYRTFLAITGLTLCIAFVLFNQWIIFPEPLAPRMLTASVSAVGAIGIWAGLWGLITRVSQGTWSLRTHTAIAANTVALCMWSDWLMGAAIFATQWRWLEPLEIAIAATAILNALYLHLRKATHLSMRNAAITAIVVPITLAGAAVWVAQQSTLRDINRIALGPKIYPPHLRVSASTEMSDYVAQVEALKREVNRKRRLSLAERPLAASE